MAIDENVQVNAKFCRRWISVGKMKELLSLLEDDDVLIPNRGGDLTIIRDSEQMMIGYIDIGLENLTTIEYLDWQDEKHKRKAGS